MRVQEFIDKLEKIDDKSKTVCVVGIRENIYINDVEESTIWNEINLTFNPIKLYGIGSTRQGWLRVYLSLYTK